MMAAMGCSDQEYCGQDRRRMSILSRNNPSEGGHFSHINSGCRVMTSMETRGSVILGVCRDDPERLARVRHDLPAHPLRLSPQARSRRLRRRRGRSGGFPETSRQDSHIRPDQMSLSNLAFPNHDQFPSTVPGGRPVTRKRCTAGLHRCFARRLRTVWPWK